jgi:hypothetical protein
MGTVLWGNLSWHPAAAAWREVAPTAPTPECIEVLRRENGTATYRLVGAGPGGTPIIARRSGMTSARVVRTIYEKMLSRLPIRASRYYAFRADGAGFAWVFLEEGGGGRP